ncbi:hypothetical protein ACOSQ2_012587 [Xanthoceras sorbifolium]
MVKKKSWERFWVALGDGCDQYAHCRESAISNRVRESAESDNAMQCTCLIGFEPLYPQDWFIRCVEKRKVPGVCGKGDGEGSVRLEGLKIPDARFSRVYGTMSFKECEKACLKSCNCTGYTSADVSKIRGGCISWFRELTDVRNYADGQGFYLRVDAVELVKYIFLDLFNLLFSLYCPSVLITS